MSSFNCFILFYLIYIKFIAVSNTFKFKYSIFKMSSILFFTFIVSIRLLLVFYRYIYKRLFSYLLVIILYIYFEMMDQ